MKTNELTIGDCVCLSTKRAYTTVQGLRIDGEDYILSKLTDVWYSADNYEPIPLTADILERSGFEKTGESPHKTEYMLEINDEYNLCLFITLFKRSNFVRIEFNPIESVDARISFSKKDCAVHDLQHVMRMCGIDKEFVL